MTQAAPTITSVTVDNSQYSGADTEEGGSIAPDQLHASFTGPASAESYNLSINWGDGTEANPDITTFSLNPGQTEFDYPLPQYASNGEYTISVTVADQEGNTSPTVQKVVTYSNSALSGLVLSFQQGTPQDGEGGQMLVGSFTDPQSNVGHVVTINWGDGTEEDPDTTTVDVDAGDNTFQAETPSYATVSTFPVLVTVSGMDGTATASTSLVATTLAVTSSASDPAIGQPITYTATVSAADSSAVNGGTVDFYDEASGTDLGTAAVVGGVATFTTTSELAGPNAVGCTFGGDGDLDTSNSTVNGDVGPAPVIDVSGAGEVNKGAITTISASVANLHGLPFRVLVNWGGNQGSPDTVAYPPGTTGFSLAHQYVDADGQAFDIAYTVGITVESLDGTVVYAQTSTSIQGTDPGESVNVINSVPFITVGTPVTLTAVVADPGENETSYTYSWSVWPSGGTPLQPGSGSTYTFTPDQDATYNWRLDVTDTDGVTTEVGNAIANSAASGGTWQADTPSVTLQQCDADGNPTAAPVIGGNTAYFKVSVSGNMPDQGNVVVYYRTTDGGAQGGIDYVPTGGSSKTLYYNGSGYSPWIISIQTIASPDQVVGNLVLSGWCYDADAKVPTAPTFSVQCTVQQSWWSATDTWSMATATGVYTGHVVAHGNPTLPALAQLITGSRE